MSQVNRLPAAMARRFDFEDAVSPRVIRDLRERIDLLEEENLQLREASRPVVSFPSEWRLTREEGRFLAVLYRSRGEYLSKEHLLTALYGLEADVDIKIIDVWTHKIRKKLADAETGIEILTHWGQGYGLSPNGRAVLRKLVPLGEKDDATRIRELEATVEHLSERAVDLMAEADRLRAIATERASLEFDAARIRGELNLTPLVSMANRFPAVWGLSRQMSVFLARLMDAEGYVSRERLCAAIGGVEGPAGTKHLQVVAHNVRRRTARYGVEIMSLYRGGYGLTEAGRLAVTRAIEASECSRDGAS